MSIRWVNSVSVKENSKAYKWFTFLYAFMAKFTYEKIRRKLRGKFLGIIHGSFLQFWIYPSFVRMKLFHFIHLKQKTTTIKKYITAFPNPGAGIGHQIANWNAAFYFANNYGLQFVHNAFSDERWEFFLGMGESEVSYNELKNVKKYRLPRFSFGNKNELKIIEKIILGNFWKRDVCFILEMDQDIICHYKTSQYLSEKYFRNKKRFSFKELYNHRIINIAVHIRRGDIVSMKAKDLSNWRLRWCDNAYFLSIINKLIPLLEKTKYSIHIFSQGAIDNFPEFKTIPEVVWHLNDDVYSTFHHLVMADILITSPSSFSNKAAMISKGIKFVKYPWWHEIPDNDKWIRVEENGMFDFNKALELLKIMLTDKF